MISVFEGFTKGGRWIPYPTSVASRKKKTVVRSVRMKNKTDEISKLFKKYVKTSGSKLKLGRKIRRKVPKVSYPKRFY